MNGNGGKIGGNKEKKGRSQEEGEEGMNEENVI